MAPIVLMTLGLLFTLGPLCAAWLVVHRGPARWHHREAWCNAAERHGLRVTRLEDESFSACTSTLRVDIDRSPKGGFETRITGPFVGFTLRSRDVLEESAFRTGDPSFDRLVVLDGDPQQALAALGRTERTLIASFIRRNATLAIEDGVLSYAVRDRHAAAISAALRIASLLVPHGASVERRLVDSYQEETRGSVRRELIGALLRDRITPEKLAVAREAMRDNEPLVRVLAAARLGREGHATLSREFKVAYRSGDLRIVGATLSAMRKARMKRSVRFARVMLGRDRDSWDQPGVRIAWVVQGAIRLLAALDPAPEQAILEVLDWKTTQHRISACDALARVGTAEAVTRLRPLASPAIGLFRNDLNEGAADAIAAIQSRIGGRLRGGLALVPPREEWGRLTLLEAGGELTEATDEVA